MSLTSPHPASSEFIGMPDDARIWIFGVSRPLAADEEAILLARMDAFLSKWAAHGHPLAAGRAWREGRFLIIAVDDSITPPSGCSTDSLMRELRSLEAEFQVQIVGNAPVWFRNPDGAPVRVTRREFRELAQRAVIGLDSPVFDLSLTRLEDLRKGGFEGPAREQWHRRLIG